MIATFSFGEPASPISIMDTAETATLLRLFFGLGAPSRLIRIIGLQNSLRPSPPRLPVGRRSARSTPLPLYPREAQSSETDSISPPAARTPGAEPRPVPALSTIR